MECRSVTTKPSDHFRSIENLRSLDSGPCCSKGMGYSRMVPAHTAAGLARPVRKLVGKLRCQYYPTPWSLEAVALRTTHSRLLARRPLEGWRVHRFVPMPPRHGVD